MCVAGPKVWIYMWCMDICLLNIWDIGDSLWLVYNGTVFFNKSILLSSDILTEVQQFFSFY